MLGSFGADEVGDVPDRSPPPGVAGQSSPGPGARLGAVPASVVSAARRRAIRDADRHVDTAHLLHTLLEADPEVRAAFGAGAQVARLLTYLVQRSIGYGLRWRGAVEDSGALRVVSAGREESGTPGLSPAAAAAMQGALERARCRGAERAEGLDLLAALVADSGCRASEVLRRAGVDRELLSARLDGSLPAGAVGGATVLQRGLGNEAV
ncbi:peptidase [Streptomyces sp. 8N616]|uniref:peptidase n=1 Tax=Streptomyces sp. 8N616 TaxID=3457414 RepID=UPI003FD15EDB